MKRVKSMVLAGVSAAVFISGSGAAEKPILPVAHARPGMNFDGPADWNTEYPFVDVFRLSRDWTSQKNGAAWGQGPELDCDDHGWVKCLERDCYATALILTGGHAPIGEYVCLFEGEGEIDFQPNAKIVSRKPGRIAVHIDAQSAGTFLELRQTNPRNPVRNIRVIMPGFEKTYRTEPFHPVFLNRWRGFGPFRFMCWQNTNGSQEHDWADRAKPDDSTWTRTGIPLEVMIDLCNRTKTDAWFCIPHRASDDYVREFAALAKRTLDPSLKVYIEYSNEVWNSQFAQHAYAEERAQALGLGPQERPWEGAAIFHGRRSVEIFRIWESVFGGRDRLVRVIAWQAAGGEYWSDSMLLANSGAGKNCDALAIAPYISMCIGPQTAPPAGEVSEWTPDQVFDYLETTALPECIGWMKTQKNVADKYGLRLVCYEAGQHLVGVGGGENNEALATLFQTANRDPRMGRLYTKYLDAWRDAGGDAICLFTSCGAWSKWGSWGLLEYAEQPEAESPKCRAVMDWTRANAPK